jgi:hypothetical protein
VAIGYSSRPKLKTQNKLPVDLMLRSDFFSEKNLGTSRPQGDPHSYEGLIDGLMAYYPLVN